MQVKRNLSFHNLLLARRPSTRSYLLLCFIRFIVLRPFLQYLAVQKFELLRTEFRRLLRGQQQRWSGLRVLCKMEGIH